MSFDFTELIENDLEHKPFQDITGKKSIHSLTSISYYEKSLKAEEYVLSICKHGLKFPFTEEPTLYEENNNKSALNNKDFVWDKLLAWESNLYIK